MKTFTYSLKQVLPCLILKTILPSLLTGVLYFTCVIHVNASPVTGTGPGVHDLSAVTFTQHPSSSATCDGSSTSFSVIASGSGTLTYEWQVSTDGGSTWGTAFNGSTYGNAGTATLSVLVATSAMNNYRYRCLVTDNSGPYFSNPATLTVNSLPVVQTTDADKYICANGGGTISAQFFAGLSYQWQVSTDGGSAWNNISDGAVYTGTAAQILSISNGTGLDGYLYRYIAKDNATLCTNTSARYILHVFQPAITSQPVTTAVCTGSPVSFTVTASSPTALTYEWQRQISGVLTPLTNDGIHSGIATNTLTIAAPVTTMNNFRYAVYVRDAYSCATLSSIVTLNVYTPLVINTQPRDTFACANTTIVSAFKVVMASGSGTLTYQWQTDNGTNGTTWSSVNSPVTTASTTSLLSLSGVTPAMNGYHYRLSVTGTCGTVYSNPVTLRVLADGTWRGTTNTDWHIATNWCGGVPTSTTDVLIPAWAPRMPEISNATGTAYSRSLHIESNARLTISGGATAMSGPFNIEGTVAYTAGGDQMVLPAAHGSLEINGGGNKYMQSDVDISRNLVLGGNAKLVTGNYLLTMKTGSNSISGAIFSGASTSWIVTGNGNSGAGNTGLGGLRIEQIDVADGNVLYPVGPTSTAYNPLQLSNTGAADHYTIAVNDQLIAGGTYQSGIDRTWLVSEAVPGGSNITLALQWVNTEESPLFDHTKSAVIRSDGTTVVQHSTAGAAAGLSPYSQSGGGYTVPTQFSVTSSAQLLAREITGLTARVVDKTTARLDWKTDGRDNDGHFIIQRSTGSPAFTDIGTVEQEAGQMIYHFTDDHLGSGTSYYRLKIDAPGSGAVYSKMLQVDNSFFSNKFELRPSVTNKELTTLYISLALKDRLVITLTDIMGRVYLNKTVQLEKGQHYLPLSIGRLVKGIYYIRVTGGHTAHQSSLQLVKQ